MEEKIINFYLDKKKLQSNYQKFAKIGKIYYPLKTNSNEFVLKEIIKLYGKSDNGFLLTHISHFYKLKKLGVNPKKMCMVNVIAEDEELKFLYDAGVRYFTFDSITSLKNFIEYADLKNTRIAIRLNIIEVFNVFSHLGASTTECKSMLQLLKQNNALDYGISFYLQKETLPKRNVLNTMLDFIVKEFENYSMTFLNLGGALRPEEIETNIINKIKRKLYLKYIILEPGRYFIGNSGYMETTIIKKKMDNVFIIQNGIYSGLLDAVLYNKKFELFVKIDENIIRLESKPIENYKEIIICGASSDSGDRIGKFYIEERYYNELDVGLNIIVNNALAYVEEFFMPLGGDLKTKYNIVDSRNNFQSINDFKIYAIKVNSMSFIILLTFIFNVLSNS